MADLKSTLTLVIMFGLSSVLIMFMSLFIYQAGDELILTPVAGFVNETAADLGLSSQITDNTNSALSQYKNLNIPFDLFFLATWISIIVVSVLTAYKSKEEGWFSFFGTLTIGIMLILFVSSYFILIKDWLVLNLIENFLEFELGTTPIFNFYISNMAIVNFVWIIALILINKLNFSINRDTEDFSSDMGGFER